MKRDLCVKGKEVCACKMERKGVFVRVCTGKVGPYTHTFPRGGVCALCRRHPSVMV